jgi:hypothetical protein
MNEEIENKIVERIKYRVFLVDSVNGLARFGQAARVPEATADDAAADVYADHFARGMLKTIEEHGFTHAARIRVDEAENRKAFCASVYLGKL